MNIWIHENDNLVMKVREIEVKYEINLDHLIAIVGAKSANSKVGIYRFLANNEICNIIVYPKSIAPDPKALADYFETVFSLIKKYPSKASEFRVNKAFLELSVKSFGGNKNSLESIIIAYYKVVLEEVLRFFSFHESVATRSLKIDSSSLDNEIDIYRTITNFDKSKIPQLKTVRQTRSFIATLAVAVLQSFKKRNQIFIEPDVLQLLNHLISFVRRKYHINKSIKPLELLFRKNQRYFRTASERALYDNLLVLLGVDNSLLGSFSSESLNRLTPGFSLFFAPEMFYELNVFDHLIGAFGNENVIFKPSRKYILKNKTSNQSYKLRSEPDFLVESDGETYLVDAKWKILSGMDSSFVYDYLKLHRDLKAFEANQIFLAYPALNQSTSNNDSFIVEQMFSCPVTLKHIPMG